MSVSHSLLHKIRTDFPGFCERFLKIKTKKGEIQPFILNRPQRIIWEQIKAMMRENRPIRLVILKARQYGISTFVQAFLLWLVMTRQGQNALIVGQNLDMAGELFGKAEMMYEMAPEWVRPSRDSKTRGKRLSFGGDNRGLLYVETAENRDAGRSATFQHVHCTEIPFWPDAKRTMDGLLQSVPKGVFSSVIVESTAHGRGDYFHQMWELANDTENWNGFTPVFIPWFEHDEYVRTALKDEILPDWIEELGRKYELSRDQLCFYHDKYQEFQCDIDTLRQEYPSDSEEAFKSSGLPFFNRESLDHQKDTNVRDTKDKSVRTGMYVVRNEKPVWVDGDGAIHIFELPEKKTRYTIGVDVATGRAADSSVLQVLKGMEQVATYRGKIDAFALADLASWVGKVYNTALIIPEVNGVGESFLLKLVNDLEYPNIFTNYKLDSTTGNEVKKYGFTTTGKNRMALLDDVNGLLRESVLKIRCNRTLKEMETFVFSDESGKRAEAAKDSHDDMVMALALAVHANLYHLSGPASVEYQPLEI